MTKNRRHQPILPLIDRCPPFMVYYLTRTSNAKLTHPGSEALAAISGLSQRTITRLSQAITWASVKVSTMDAFCKACEISMAKTWRSKAMMPSKKRGMIPVSTIRTVLLVPHRTYIWHLIHDGWKKPLRHLNTHQKNRFNTLCRRWAELQAAKEG